MKTPLVAASGVFFNQCAHLVYRCKHALSQLLAQRPPVYELERGLHVLGASELIEQHRRAYAQRLRNLVYRFRRRKELAGLHNLFDYYVFKCKIVIS